jgi:hypothetical protein
MLDVFERVVDVEVCEVCVVVGWFSTRFLDVVGPADAERLVEIDDVEGEALDIEDVENVGISTIL